MSEQSHKPLGPSSSAGGGTFGGSGILQSVPAHVVSHVHAASLLHTCLNLEWPKNTYHNSIMRNGCSYRISEVNLNMTCMQCVLSCLSHPVTGTPMSVGSGGAGAQVQVLNRETLPIQTHHRWTAWCSIHDIPEISQIIQQDVTTAEKTVCVFRL